MDKSKTKSLAFTGLEPKQTKGPIGKKLILKNFREPKLPENYTMETWHKLKASVEAILLSRPVVYSLEELYQAVENMCSHKMASSLHYDLSDLTEQHVKKYIYQLTGEATDNEVFLKRLNDCWLSHCRQMIMIRSVFLYLDRTFVLQNPTVISIWDMGLDQFRACVVLNNVVKCRTIEGLLALIERERRGDTVDRSLLKSLLRMLGDLQLYNVVFEKEFLQATDKLYASEGRQMIRDLTLPQYLLHVQKRLVEEQERLLHYLDSGTKVALIHILEKQLISEHTAAILDTGLATLVEAFNLKHITLLYNLLGRVKNGHSLLCTQFNVYIKSVGKTLVVDPEKDNTMVQELLEFKDKMDLIVTECFDHNDKFVNSLKEAFEHFVNLRTNKPAELIAKYLDIKLRGGHKGCSEEEMEKLLDRIMVLFRFIHGKDVFEAFYKKDLSKRLLLGKSASVDSEKSMLLKLKQECGPGFTSKLEGMFKDIELSHDINVAYKKHLAQPKSSDQSGDIDLTVSILTMGFWPSYQTFTDVILPNNLAQAQARFRDFFLSKHQGKQLYWKPQLGYCVLISTFIPGTKELVVSTFQALVLMLFNNREEMSYEDIKSHTAIENDELKRTLQSLACSRTRVLIKEPKGINIEDEDIFTYNAKFSNPRYRVKINQIQLKETAEEHKNTEEKVYIDRQMMIDAAIVRIMKTRKFLSHNLLISELYNQLKFPVVPSDLKKRIESLIDRDYMARDKENASTYNYVA